MQRSQRLLGKLTSFLKSIRKSSRDLWYQIVSLIPILPSTITNEDFPAGLSSQTKSLSVTRASIAIDDLPRLSSLLGNT